MLGKYWRLRMLWTADQTLTYDNGARIVVRSAPWKYVSGALDYGTTVVEDLGFSAGETIVTTGQVEGSVVDNTTNKYLGVEGYFEVTADADSTDGQADLYVEFSDDNTNWPSDQADFEITDLRFLCAVVMSTDAVDESRGKNFAF